MVGDTGNYDEKTQFLQRAYLGYCVVRPLPGSPIGRTVLVTFGPTTPTDTRSFDAVRDYDVHLAGFKLTIRGLAFQQQDQGVSACATTALWSSLNKVAQLEALAIPTPAEITQAASRYLLSEGRALPSEGLNINQICEAIRGSGLQPLVSRSVSFDQDCAQLTLVHTFGPSARTCYSTCTRWECSRRMRRGLKDRRSCSSNNPDS